MCKLKKGGLTMVFIMLTFLLAIPVLAAGKSYDISFRAGSHGTINGAESTTLAIGYQEPISFSGIIVSPESGYYFTGWSPTLASPVTEQATYVAQYARIIDQAVYRVNYIDNFGNEMATQRVAVTNYGISVTEYAQEIDGYAVDVVSQTVPVQKTGTEITFTYTSQTEPDIINQIQTITIPGGTTVTTTNAAAATTAPLNPAAADGTTPAADGTTPAADGTTPDQATENVPDNQTPQQGSEDIEDSETPLAPSEEADQGGSITNALIGGIATIVIIGGAIAIILKRKKMH